MAKKARAVVLPTAVLFDLAPAVTVKQIDGDSNQNKREAEVTAPNDTSRNDAAAAHART